MGKSEELKQRILQEQREHAKVSAWIARIERWQRTVNKGHWLGEQPDTCGSWILPCLQEMQRENLNTSFDMCTEGLQDPLNKLPYRKRTKLNHTSGILHHLMTTYRQCDASRQHQPIEQTNKYQDATGKWRTVNRSTFAGWYTIPFREDVIDSFSQEFATGCSRRQREADRH